VLRGATEGLQQSAKALIADDLPLADLPGTDRLVAEALVGTLRVVVVDVFAQDLLQVLRTEE
jgi:hypothetical protein